MHIKNKEKNALWARCYTLFQTACRNLAKVFLPLIWDDWEHLNLDKHGCLGMVSQYFIKWPKSKTENSYSLSKIMMWEISSQPQYIKSYLATLL